MLTINDKWPTNVNNLIYIERGLNKNEKDYIFNILNTNAMRLFVNLRYAPDPIRYDNMTKT